MSAAATIVSASSEVADDEPDRAVPAPLHLAPPDGVRVLVVDDDLLVRRAVRRLLVRHGFEVATAIDVAPALAAVRDRQPDLVLVDLGMPTSGIELVRALKSEFGDAMYVAVLSGWTTEQLQDQCIECGADDYFTKGMTPSDLQRHLVVAARKQRAYVDSRARREQAERARAYGSEAASMLAHDLNNNLAAGLMNLDYLATTKGLGDEQREVVDATRYSLQRMAALVANFVDIARFEDDRLVPVLEDTPIAQLIDRVTATHQKPHGVPLERACDRTLSGALDRGLVERVLHNLVVNAVRYTKAGGRIAVTARAWPTDDHTGGVEIEVHNTGPQVAAAAASRLFSKYGRGNDGARGVGLYFCRLVCAAHQGSIELVPEADGPTFRVRLPGRAMP